MIKITLKRIIDTIKENLLNNDTCDECNQLLTECDCDDEEHNHDTKDKNNCG